MYRHWICRRMAWGALLGAGYSLWTVCAHLPAGLDRLTWLGSAAWTVGILTAAGSVLTGAVAVASLSAACCVRPNRRPTLAAAIETAIWMPLVLWLVLNEFVYSLTAEVVGIGALLMLWHNTAAVLQNAWAMGGRYLVATGAIVLTACVAICTVSARSFRRLIEATQHADAASLARPGGMRGWALALMSGSIVLAGLAAWEFRARLGKDLMVTCRSVPSLRAANLVRILSGEKLEGSVPKQFGSPVISEARYAAGMGSPRTPAPHVVFLLLESTPAKALHCYGNPHPDVTPNLDRLAAEGIRFEHCVAPSSSSSCSVVSMATSLYMMRGSRFDHFRDISFPFLTLPRALKLGGYELALFSSGNETFDRINQFIRPADFDTYFSQDTSANPQPDVMRMDDRIAVGEFEKWMAGRTDPRPFYCGFYLQSPHFNYEIPEPWASHYRPVPPLYSNTSVMLQIPPDVLPKIKNQYNNAVRYMDYWVGRIRDDLDKAGVLDNTVIVATGDHGEAFMEHGLGRHGTHTWEEMIHTPLIIWAGPQVRSAWTTRPPSVVADTVSGLDIAPTLAGLVGIAPYPGWQGVDVLAPGYSDQDRPVFSMTQYTRCQETVCINRIKYIYDLTDAVEYLFDLRCDPGEHNNLAREQPALAAAMRSILTGWHTRQLGYYSAPNRAEYVGNYVPDAAALDAFHQAVEAIDAPAGEKP